MRSHGLVIFGLLLAVFQPASSSDSATLSGQFEKLRQRHDDAVYKATRDQAGREELDSVRRDRGEAFASFLGHAQSCDPTSLSYEDLGAIAECAEFLNKPDVAARYGELAVTRDPTVDRAYYTYVRALLNLSRLDDAERVVLSAEDRFPPDAHFRSLFGILHEARKADGKPKEAARHMDKFIAYVLQRVPQDQQAGHALARYLLLLRTVETARADSGELDERVKGYVTTLRSTAVPIADRAKETGVPVGHCLAIYDALYSAEGLLAPEQRPQLLKAWLRKLTDEIPSLSTDEGIFEIEHLTKRLDGELAPPLYDAKSLEGLVTLRTWLGSRSERSSEAFRAKLIKRLSGIVAAAGIGALPKSNL